MAAQNNIVCVVPTIIPNSSWVRAETKNVLLHNHDTMVCDISGSSLLKPHRPKGWRHLCPVLLHKLYEEGPRPCLGQRPRDRHPLICPIRRQGQDSSAVKEVDQDLCEDLWCQVIYLFLYVNVVVDFNPT